MDHDAGPYDASGNFRPKRRRLRGKPNCVLSVEGDYEIWHLSARQLSGVVFAYVFMCSAFMCERMHLTSVSQSVSQ